MDVEKNRKRTWLNTDSLRRFFVFIPSLNLALFNPADLIWLCPDAVNSSEEGKIAFRFGFFKPAEPKTVEQTASFRPADPKILRRNALFRPAEGTSLKKVGTYSHTESTFIEEICIKMVKRLKFTKKTALLTLSHSFPKQQQP